jgi:hypothetical protein
LSERQTQQKKSGWNNQAFSLFGILIAVDPAEYKVQFSGGLTEALDNHTRGLDNLTGMVVLIELVQTAPLTKVLSCGDLN